MFNKEIQAIIRRRFSDIVPEVKASILTKRRRDRSSPTSCSHLSIKPSEYGWFINGIIMEHNKEKKYRGGGFGKVKEGYPSSERQYNKKPKYAIKIYKKLEGYGLIHRVVLARREARFYQVFGNTCFWGTIEEKAYLIVPWIPGPNLSEHQNYIAHEFKTSGTITFKIQDRLTAFGPYLVQTILLHLLGLIWGDTKPLNIMLNSQTRSLQGIDFDAIRFEGYSGGSCTRTYLPPRLIYTLNDEKLSYSEKQGMVEKNYQQADDIFISGVILALWIPELFEVTLSLTLNKKPPYSSPEIKVKEAAISSKDKWLVDLIKEMTDENPEKRPTAQACLQELSKNLSHYGCSLESNLLYKQFVSQVAKTKEYVRKVMIDELFIAIRNNDSKLMTAILDQYPDLVNTVSIGEKKISPLTAAVLYACPEMIEPLLKRGADVLEIETSALEQEPADKINTLKITCLIEAVKNAPEDKLKTIISKTKYLINSLTPDGDYALLSALTIPNAASKKIKIRLLLENGADIFVPDQKGKCMLTHVMEKKDWTALDAILSVKPELLNESVSISSSRDTLFNEAIKNKDHKLLAVLCRHIPEYFHPLNSLNSIPKIPIFLLINLINKASKFQVISFIENFCANLEKLEKPSSKKNMREISDYGKIRDFISFLKDLLSSINSLSPEDRDKLFMDKNTLVKKLQILNTTLSTEPTSIIRSAVDLAIICSIGENKDSSPSELQNIASWQKIQSTLYEALKNADEKAIQSFLTHLRKNLDCLSPPEQDVGDKEEFAYAEMMGELSRTLESGLQDNTLLELQNSIFKQLSVAFDYLGRNPVFSKKAPAKDLCRAVLSASPALFGAKPTPGTSGESKPVRFYFLARNSDV
jgi:serine/threonine protein kinase